MRGWPAALGAALLLFLALVALYWPATGFDFVEYDDPAYARDDPAIQGGLSAAGLKEAFTPRYGFFIPLTWLSLQADVSLFGHGPAGFHRTNIFLFAVAMAGFLLLAWRLTGSLAVGAAAASLAAFHPMRVESVAWVTERKDCLSLLLLVLALSAYLRYTRSGKGHWMGATCLLLSLGLMAKPTLVTFPVLLLLLDLWPLGRLRHPLLLSSTALLREKASLFAISASFAAVTLLTHAPYTFGSEYPTTLGERAARFFLAPWITLRKTFWPNDLAVVNVLPDPSLSWGWALAGAAALAAATWGIWRLAGGRWWALFGWLWFLAALSPQAGLFRTGITWIADRHSLIPHLGLALALAGGAAPAALSALPPLARRATGAVAWAAAVAVLALLTHAQLPAWKDSLNFFLNSLSRQSELFSYTNLGAYLDRLAPGVEERRHARELLQERLAREPSNPVLHYHLGDLLFAEGELPGAVAHLQVALATGRMPRDARGLGNARLGEALIGLGRDEEALAPLREALAIHPEARWTYETLGEALLRLGRKAEAAPLLEEASRLARDRKAGDR